MKINPIGNLVKTNPNKANLLDAQMNVNKVLTKDYERNDIFAVPENKANSNPTSKAKKCHFEQFEKKLVAFCYFLRHI